MLTNTQKDAIERYTLKFVKTLSHEQAESFYFIIDDILQTAEIIHATVKIYLYKQKG